MLSVCQGAVDGRAAFAAAKARSGQPSVYHPKVTRMLEEWFIEVGVGGCCDWGVNDLGCVFVFWGKKGDAGANGRAKFMTTLLFHFLETDVTPFFFLLRFSFS